MRAEAMAAYTRSVLEPLVAALERSEDHVAELERANGRQSAEIERATATITDLTVERDAARAEVDALKAAQAKQEAQLEPELPPPVPTTRSTPVALLARFWPLLIGVLALVAAAVTATLYR